MAESRFDFRNLNFLSLYNIYLHCRLWILLCRQIINLPESKVKHGRCTCQEQPERVAIGKLKLQSLACRWIPTSQVNKLEHEPFCQVIEAVMPWCSCIKVVAIAHLVCLCDVGRSNLAKILHCVRCFWGLHSVCNAMSDCQKWDSSHSVMKHNCCLLRLFIQAASSFTSNRV